MYVKWFLGQHRCLIVDDQIWYISKECVDTGSVTWNLRTTAKEEPLYKLFERDTTFNSMVDYEFGTCFDGELIWVSNRGRDYFTFSKDGTLAHVKPVSGSLKYAKDKISKCSDFELAIPMVVNANLHIFKESDIAFTICKIEKNGGISKHICIHSHNYSHPIGEMPYSFTLQNLPIKVGRKTFAKFIGFEPKISIALMAEIVDTWDVERVLWIGNLKESHEEGGSILSKLPRDVIRLILKEYTKNA